MLMIEISINSTWKVCSRKYEVKGVITKGQENWKKRKIKGREEKNVRRNKINKKC